MTLYDIWQRDHTGDFAAGVALLVQHNPSAVTKGILVRFQTLAATGAYVGNYERGKLAYALQRSAAAGSPGAPPVDGRPILSRSESSRSASPIEGGKGVEQTAPPPSAPDAKLTSEKAIALHKEHAHVHALMVAAPNETTRAELARQIMDHIIPALNEEYDRLRAAPSPLEGGQGGENGEVDNTGIAPILNANSAADFKKLQSVRSRISTLRGKIKKEKDPKKKAKREQELETKIAERERLENELS